MPKNDTDPATVTELAACPSSPNCVCSADIGGAHFIEALQISGEPALAWQALGDILNTDRSIKIVATGDNYIRAEAKTRLLRFTDDVEFLRDDKACVINMRSASRLGYSDLGKNRNRLEGLRSAMRQAGVLK